MKILVTGGAGFIGSHVADAYLAAGHEVVIVDDLSTGLYTNVPHGAKYCPLDICEHDRVTALIRAEKPDVINHHAAQMDVRRSVREPLYDARVNILGTLGLIDAAQRCGVQKFIYVSTGGAVHGQPRRQPVYEDDPIAPECHYGVSKHTPEHYLALYRKLYGLDYTVLRYPNVYGPRQRPDGEAGVVAIFAGKMLRGEQPTIFGGGRQARDYVYVSDIARANVAALTSGSGEIVGLGSEYSTATLTIYGEVARATGYIGEPAHAPLRPGEIDTICLSGAKAKMRLGWEPTVSLTDGIRLTVESLKS